MRVNFANMPLAYHVDTRYKTSQIEFILIDFSASGSRATQQKA